MSCKTYKKIFLTYIRVGNTIVAHTTIGGTRNVKKNFFLHEAV